ncbi:MAG: hypothetical protein ABUT20_42735, partial [Bacteroidota bacterium]
LWELGQASGIAGLQINDPNAKYKKLNPLFGDAGYTDQLIASDRKTLVKKDPIPSFKPPLKFQKVVVPTNFPGKKYEGYIGNNYFIGPHYFVFEITKPGAQNYMDMAGGIVTGGGGDKSINVYVSEYKGSLESGGKNLLQFNYFNKVSGRVDTQRINLQKLPKGYYLMRVDDPRKYFKVMFSPSISYSLITAPDNRYWGASFYTCFYVPKGTVKFRVFKDIEVSLISPTGRKIDFRIKKPEELDVDVQPGEEGLWYMSFVNGKFHIEGIPPILGMDASHMLIPQ